MEHGDYSDDYLRAILETVRVIAVVGASPRPDRPSHRVMRYLQRQGYRTIPVNPLCADEAILGETCYPSLAAIPLAVDMVDVFRRAQAVGGVVDEAITLGPKAIWLQLGLRDDAAARRAEVQGISVVMNRCPAIEIPRLAIAAR
jgi:predicted CoA-binding protein